MIAQHLQGLPAFLGMFTFNERWIDMDCPAFDLLLYGIEEFVFSLRCWQKAKGCKKKHKVEFHDPAEPTRYWRDAKRFRPLNSSRLEPIFDFLERWHDYDLTGAEVE